MINVTVFRNSDKVYCGIEIEGHAGFAEHGKDIVCAAVSVLALNMANSVEQFTDDTFAGGMEEKTGRFWFHFDKPAGSDSKLLMNSLVLGIQNIVSEYGKPYIKIQFKEV